jgi:hypothetical protein
MRLNVAVTQNRGANIEQFFFFGRFALESWGKEDLWRIWCCAVMGVLRRRFFINC